MSIRIKPIVIRIKDKKRFGDVAFLVDREDFIVDIMRLRKKWRLSDKLLRLTDKRNWSTFPWKLPDKKTYKSYKKKLPLIEKKIFDMNYMDKLGIKEREDLLKEYEELVRCIPSENFSWDIRELRKKYKKPPNFDRIIAKSLLYGIVLDSDYITVELKIVKPELDYIPYFKEPELNLIFYPLAKLEEIQAKYKEGAQELIKEYEKYYIGGKVLDSDTVSNIYRDRKWYWIKKNRGIGTRKLHKLLMEKKEPITLKGIEKALNRYEKHLKIKL